MADYLLNEQANIAVFDPQVKEAKILSDLDYLESRSSDLNRKGIITSFIVQKPAFVFDGRNILDAKKMADFGFIFQSVGRSN